MLTDRETNKQTHKRTNIQTRSSQYSAPDRGWSKNVKRFRPSSQTICFCRWPTAISAFFRWLRFTDHGKWQAASYCLFTYSGSHWYISFGFVDTDNVVFGLENGWLFLVATMTIWVRLLAVGLLSVFYSGPNHSHMQKVPLLHKGKDTLVAREQ